MPVIAILTDSYNIFQRRYIDSIAVRLKTQGYGLIVVSGRELKPDARSNIPIYNHANRIYSVAKSYDVAGFVVLSGCIGHNLDRKELNDFAEEFTALPTVSLGIDLPSVSSICSPSHSGMRQLMEHLTEDGSRNNFVFIRGFKNDTDSIERESVFRTILQMRGIPVKEHLIITGNYVAVDAYNALDSVLAKYPEIDAIVAANDDMASAAIEVLKKHRLRIPKDVVVSGFDNSSVAKETAPPLTSVQQPFDEHVIATVDTLMFLIRNAAKQPTVQPTQYFTGDLIKRESTTLNELPKGSSQFAFHGSPDEAWEQFFSTFVRDYEFTFKRDDGQGYEALLFMIRDRLRVQPDGIRELFADLSQNIEHSKRDSGWWLEFEKLLSELALRLSQSGIFTCYLTPLIEFQIQVRNFNLSLKRSEHYNFEQGALHHARLESMLAVSKDLNDIKNVLDIYFCHHNINRAFIVLYKSKGGSVDCLARVFYTYQSNITASEVLKDVNQNTFESRDILPQSLKEELDTGTLVLDPLYVGEVQLGYSLLDPTGVRALNYEYFAYALSDALNRCYHSSVVEPTVNLLH